MYGSGFRSVCTGQHIDEGGLSGTVRPHQTDDFSILHIKTDVIDRRQSSEPLVHALDADTGKTVWTYAAGGRVDSPPTVRDGFVYFGSAAESDLDSTLILVRRGDSTIATPIHEMLGAGRIVVEPDSLLLLDVTVLLGRDLSSARGISP